MRETLGVLILAVALVSSPAIAVAAEPVDDAQRLRAEFGLDSSRATALESYADRAKYDNLDWGAPLTQAEANRIYDRVKVVEATQPSIAKAEAQPGYAGMYYDQLRNGVPVFLFAEKRAAAEAAIKPKLGGVNFETKKVERSRADLLEIKQEILAERSRLKKAGAVLSTVGLDIQGNRVEVGIFGNVAKARSMLDGYGAGVNVIEQAPPVFDACTAANNCRPAKGGIKVVGDVSFCTSGFMGRRTDISAKPLVLFTAGHCNKWAQSSSWTKWKHGVGASEETAGWDESVIFNLTEDDLPTDAMLIDLKADFEPDNYFDKILVASGSQTVRRVDDWAMSQSEHMVGTPICRMGAGSAETSGYPSKKCGTIRVKQQDNLSCSQPGNNGQCQLIKNTVRVSFDSTGGDSGGPYWAGQKNGTSPVTAMGLHVHSDVDGSTNARGWYTPIHRAVSAFDWKNGVTVKVCIDANC